MDGNSIIFNLKNFKVFSLSQSFDRFSFINYNKAIENIIKRRSEWIHVYSNDVIRSITKEYWVKATNY